MSASAAAARSLRPLRAALAQCMLIDQGPLLRELKALEQAGTDAPRRDERLAALAAAIDASRARRQARAARLPQPEFPEQLPVSRQREEIAAAIAAHPVVILCGETGSGKTTQLPKICLALGRGAAGLIGHTQPRRIAARSVAARIAEELKTPLGAAVGYQVRFTERASPDTLIKVMTDGILLAETQRDRLLARYDTLIIDEAHERSLNIDFLLGYLRRLLPRRPELKIIVTSATLEPERLSAHFSGAPIVRVGGRSYPVEIRYRPPGENDPDEKPDARQRGTASSPLEGLLAAVDELSHAGPGDILVFLPGEREIREAAEALRKHHPPHTEILPLYARLSSTEQSRVFAAHAGRRIVLATNVAETSLTVPGIRYVVDTGTARISRYSHRAGLQRLPIEKISQSSADQRTGRCGRVAPGICIRLYAEPDYLSRRRYTEPEILRTNLAAVILRMLALRLGDVEDFPFVDAPDRRYVNDGYRLLHELGAVDAARALTPRGRDLARLPIDPRLGRMLLAARDTGALTEALIIVAGLSIQDPRERPADAAQAADARHREYQDPDSDFLTLLNLWRAYHEAARHLSKSKLRAFCSERFLSAQRMREWQDIHHQLRELTAELGLQPNEQPADYPAIHRALLCGLLSHIALRQEQREYLGARQVKFQLFPGSGLTKKPPAWIMAAERVESTRHYLRTAARIEPEWLEPLAQHLLKRSHSDPHFSRRRGEVMVDEQVTLFGLVIVARRPVPFSPIDAAQARELFIRSALVAGELDGRWPFLAHNRALIAELEDIEAKSRRRDVLVDEEALYRLYAARLPDAVAGAHSLKEWLVQANDDSAQRLHFTRDDLMQDVAPVFSGAQFPDVLEIGGLRLPLEYCFDPGNPRDGVNLTVPLAALNQLDTERLEWLVPGLCVAKIEALLRTLPKTLRRHVVPVPDFARACAEALRFGVGALAAALAHELLRMTGVAIPAEAFAAENVPEHLRIHLRVVDEQNRTLAEGRDLAALRAGFGASVQQAVSRAGPERYSRQDIVRWDFGELPDSITIERNGMRLLAFPALIDRGDSVALELSDSKAHAEALTRAGIIRLLLLALRDRVKFARRQVPAALGLQFRRLPPDPCAHAARSAMDDGELADELIFAAVERALPHEPAIRTQAAFEAQCSKIESRFLTDCNALRHTAETVLQLRAGIVAALPRAAATIQTDVSEQLIHLLHRHFLRNTEAEWLAHLPRYLKAMAVRLERARTQPGRDAARQAAIAPHWRRWKQTACAADASATAPALRRIRWLIEELRVSLFAQELKTALPISAERLTQEWQAMAQPRPRKAV